MSELGVSIVIAVFTFIASVGTSMFVAGTRWGRVEATLNDIQSDRVRRGDIHELDMRLARIEGMFTLTLKGPDNPQ